jgi:hypothetical protein
VKDVTNWIELEVQGQVISEEEISRQLGEQDAHSEVLGIVLYELGCLDEEQQRPLRHELGIDSDLTTTWLRLYVNEEMDGSAEPFWQAPSDAASKLQALAKLFDQRTEAAQYLWRLSLNGIFDNLMPRALEMRVETDRPSPGCASGDWACHLAYCLRATAEVVEGLSRQGETAVLLTFAPFY